MRIKMRNCRAMIMSADRIAESNERLGRDIRQANKELADRMSENYRAEIKARDRVDIPLDTYEKLMRSLEYAKNENMTLWNIFNKLGVPADVIHKIIPDRIRTEQCHDHMRFKNRYRIEFEVEDRA